MSSVCAQCKSTVTPGKFCTSCGTKAPLAPPPSAAAPSSAKFCSKCGEILNAAKFCTGCGGSTTSSGSSSVEPVKSTSTSWGSGGSSSASSGARNSINNSTSFLPSSTTTTTGTTSSPSVSKWSSNKTPKSTEVVRSTPTSFAKPAEDAVPFSKVQLKKAKPPPPRTQKQAAPTSSDSTDRPEFAGFQLRSVSGGSTSFTTGSSASDTSSTPAFSGVKLKASTRSISPPPSPRGNTVVASSTPTSYAPPTPQGPKPPVPGAIRPAPPLPSTSSSFIRPAPPISPPTASPVSSTSSICPKCGCTKETKFCTQCGYNPSMGTAPPPPPAKGTVPPPPNKGIPPPPTEPATPPAEAPPAAMRKWAVHRTNSVSGTLRSSASLESTMEDNEEGTGDRRKTLQLAEPDRRSWKKKYDTLKKEGRSQTTTTLPSTPLSSRERSYTDKSGNPLDSRSRVIMEIIETEADYVQDLQTMIDVFLNPMRKEAIATPQEIATIFTNLEIIIGVNKQLLEAFRHDPTAVGIGKAFCSTADYLKMYAYWCSNQTASFATINALKAKKDKKFESFLQYCFARPECSGLDFNAYMIKPVQRICKYPLLLRELIKETDQSNADYPQLQEAFEKIENIVLVVNEKKRESELTQKIIEISTLLVGAEQYEIVTPTRRFIREGELQHYASNGKLKHGYLFLFNDLFLYTKKKGSKYHLKLFAPLPFTVIRYVSTYEKPTFEIVCNGYAAKPWPIVTDTEDEKFSLMEEIQELIDKNNLEHQQITRRNSSTSLPKITTPWDPTEAITFDCEYSDHRTITLPRNNCSYDVLYWTICEQFQVEGATVMFGQQFIDSQQELDALLAPGGTQFSLLIYDPY